MKNDFSWGFLFGIQIWLVWPVKKYLTALFTNRKSIKIKQYVTILIMSNLKNI